MTDIKYHITPNKNLTSILTSGLKVNSTLNCIGRFGCYKRIIKAYGKKPIFLNDDPYRLAQEQLTLRWVSENNPVVLKVNTKDLDLINEYAHVDWLYQLIPPDYTWICLKDIEHDRLSLTDISLEKSVVL